MPRREHKEGCQCAICKKMRAKELRERTEEIQPVEEIPAPVIPQGITLASLAIGEAFRYQVTPGPTRVFKKISEYPDIDLIMVLDLQSNEAERMHPKTIVEPIPKGHEIEKEE